MISRSKWKRISIFLPGIPRGKSSPRSSVLRNRDGKIVSKNGRPIIHHRKSEEQERDEVRIMAMLLNSRPAVPISGPVRIHIRAQFPVPLSKSKKWKREAIQGLHYPTKKPDWDNIGKHLCDCMNTILWIDDAQVISGMVEKTYSDTPGYTVVIDYLVEDKEQ